MLCYESIGQGKDPTTNGRSHNFASGAAVPASIAHAGGFSLLVLWLIVTPRTLLVQSTNVYNNALLMGISFAGGMVLCALAVTIAAKCRRCKEKTPFPWKCAGFFGAALSLVATFAFLFATQKTERIVFACVQMAAGTPVLLWWGANVAADSYRRSMSRICAAFGIAAAMGLPLTLAGSVSGLSSNVAEWSGATLAIAAFLPLASMGIGAKTSNANGGFSTAATGNESAHAAPIKRKQLFVLFATLAFTSLVISLFNGFTFVPHQFNAQNSYLLEFALTLAVTGGAFVFAKFSENAQSAPFNALGIPTFTLVVIGMVSLNIGIGASATIPHGLLLAAADCLLAFGMVILVNLGSSQALANTKKEPEEAQEDIGTQNRFDEARLAVTWTCGLLLTGLVYGSCAGIAIRRAFGYDISLLTSVASVCVALFAILYFTQVGLTSTHFGHSDSHHAFPNEASADATAGSMPHNAIAEDVKDTSAMPSFAPAQKAGDLDAEAAHQVVVSSYQSILAAYGLSNREIQVAEYVLEGYDAATIGTRLGIHEGTVRYHLTNIYRKANVLSKVELIDLVKSARTAGTESENAAE